MIIKDKNIIYLNFIKRLLRRLFREILCLKDKTLNIFSTSYFDDQSFKNYSFNKFFTKSYGNLNVIPNDVLKMYLNHYFDLLGSGWKKNQYNMVCSGINGIQYNRSSINFFDDKGLRQKGKINFSNQKRSIDIWCLLDKEYKPIDWHIDTKSGYRWSEKTWYKSIKYGHKKGVDVKLPWELSRMQHLPQMALILMNSEIKNEYYEKIQFEFRNQILDFISTNPPKYGVNWNCTMDVAIRAANWVLAYEIMRVSNINFNNNFKKHFFQSLISHGRHILSNLEWNYGKRGNHYLSNIVGLSFISIFLPSNKETDSWLIFSIQELIKEFRYQFNSDGTNFEGSTTYHCLATEMIYLSTSIILGMSKSRIKRLEKFDISKHNSKYGNKYKINKPITFQTIPKEFNLSVEKSPFPLWFFKRMVKMFEFVMDVTKPNGKLTQIGDNDSGRFFKLSPKFDKISVEKLKKSYSNLNKYKTFEDNSVYHLECSLNFEHIIAAGFAIFKNDKFKKWLEKDQTIKKIADYQIVKMLMNEENPNLSTQNKTFISSENSFTIGERKKFEEVHNRMKFCDSPRLIKNIFPLKNTFFKKDLRLSSYANFGVYLILSKDIYIGIRCCTETDFIEKGHRHQDQLSVELNIRGEDIISDPGTFLYTPFPLERWKYRIADNHFSPIFNENLKFNNYPKNVFYPIKIPKVKINYFGKSGFYAKTNGLNINSELLIYIDDNNIHIYRKVNLPNIKNCNIQPDIAYSNGYGKVLLK